MINWIGNAIGAGQTFGAAAPDTPSVTSVSVEDASPKNWVVIFNRAVTSTSTGWTLKIDGVAATISGTAGTGTSTITFTTTETVANGDVLTLDYNSGTGNCVSVSDSTALASLTAFSVTNNVAVVANEPVASSVSVSDSLGVYSLSYSYSSPLSTAEANKPPIIDEVNITSSGTPGYKIGDTLTSNITGFESFDGSSAGTHTYEWYRASDNQDTGLAVISGETSSSYVLTSADDGKYIYVIVTPVQTGSVANLSGSPVKSFYTIQIATALPPIYVTIDPVYIFLNGGWNPSEGASGSWPNSGSESGAIPGVPSAVPTLGANGEAVYDGTKGIKSTINGINFAAGGWTLWMKIKANQKTVRKVLFEQGSGIDFQISNSGNFMLQGFTTTGSISTGVNYNLIAWYDGTNTGSIRVEEDDGTLLLNETGLDDGKEPSANLIAIGMDTDGTDKFDGSISEIGWTEGEVSAANRTDLMTRLKGITL